MLRVKLGSARCGFLLLSVLGCALLLGAACSEAAASALDAGSAQDTGSAQDAGAAQEIQVITRAGQKQMLAKPGTDAVGARDPDVVIVEYFDYNCPFCKQLVPALQALVAQDPKLAILYKDWPILGPVSQYA